METEERRAIEAVLMVAETPVEPSLLAQLLELTPARVAQICEELAQSYRDEQRGFELVRVAGGYRFQSHPELAPYIERFVLEGQTARLSAAALETLAIVAYKQPVSRAQVASIRGVNSDGVIRTLCHRGYISEVGHDPGPAKPPSTAPLRCFSSASASTGSTSSLRSAISSPGLRSWTPWNRGCGHPADGLRLGQPPPGGAAINTQRPRPPSALALTRSPVHRPGPSGSPTDPAGPVLVEAVPVGPVPAGSLAKMA